MILNAKVNVMRKPPEIFRENVKRRLLELDLTQNKLADQMGKSGAALSRNLSGDNIGLEIISELAERLEVTIPWLFTDHNRPPDFQPSEAEERLAALSLIFGADKKKLGAIREVLGSYLSPASDDRNSGCG